VLLIAFFALAYAYAKGYEVAAALLKACASA
jgi:hypothetical protein